MNTKSIADMRLSYTLDTLGDREVFADPIAQFSEWFQEICSTDVLEANAMMLATVDENGIPEARTVLMKEFDADGIVFYTNYHSAKGKAIDANPNVSALFYWPSLQRQVRWTGVATRVSPDQSDEYFASRPRGSQIGAIVSDQSEPIESTDTLRAAWERLEQEYGDDTVISRPKQWGGYRIRPVKIEFWQGRENRLHDRILFSVSDQGWTSTRLAP